MNAFTSALRDAASSGKKKPLVLTGNKEQDQEALDAIKKGEEDAALSKWVRDQYTKCKNQLAPIKRQWYLNLAFHKGDQYVDFVDDTLIRIPAPEKKVRLVINRIKPVVRTEVSRMTSQQPSASVVAATSEAMDIEAAKAATAVFESLQERLGLQKVLRKTAWWASVCGIGFIKTFWDPEYESEDYNKLDPTGEPSVIYGDHCYTSVSPFNIMVPDLLEEEIEKQAYVLNIFTKPLEWISQRYPVLVKKEEWNPKIVSDSEIMEPRYFNLKGNSDGNKPQPNAALIIEAWIKPGNCKLLPKGGMVTLIDEHIVEIHTDGIPYDHGEYPFAAMNSVQTGTFYSSSVVEDLIPLQREINRTKSQLLEARNKMANPGFFYRSQSLDPNKWTSGMAQLIDLKPGTEFPQPIPLPNMPAYVSQLIPEFLSDIEDISGQHQVSKGNAPAGVTAGTAIQFLQEADNSFLATTHASIEECVKKIAKQSIQLAIQFWDSARLVKYVGKNNMVSAKYLQSSDLKGATDVRVEGGSSLPQSKAARIAMFTDFMARGVMPPDQGLKMMNIQSMQAYYDLVDVDENQAIRENIAMSELDPMQTEMARTRVSQMVQAKMMQVAPVGMDPTQNPQLGQLQELANAPAIEVHDWDNHEVHIATHERHMKSQEYENYPDPIKNEFELHRQKHLDMQMQNAFKQSFQQMGQQQDQQQGSICWKDCLKAFCI